jgi:adenylate kinase family enzyme
MQRVSVVGNSGSGKSTLAADLARRLGLEHVELDSINHQADWQPLPPDELRRRVVARLDAAAEGWVVCGNYQSVLDAVWERADTVVWLDLPRGTVMRRVVGRTMRRTISRRELWNGNREPLTGMVRWDPERSIVRWAWTRHDMYRERYEAAMADPATRHLAWVRLQRASDVGAWLDTIPSPGT